MPRDHTTASEIERTADVMRLVPRGYRSVLDAGARDGFLSLRLTDFFDRVTALDLNKPEVRHERISCVAGDLTQLPYRDMSFDVVVCCEVLEHIPAVEKAVAEIQRVAKHAVVIGVPYKQDIRVGRSTCVQCGKISNQWGHVHSFDEHRLKKLFHPFRIIQQTLTGNNSEKTNKVAVWLTDMGRNPYGIYHPDECCLHCGSSLESPPARTLFHKVCGAVGTRLTRMQTALAEPHANWVHMVFER